MDVTPLSGSSGLDPTESVNKTCKTRLEKTINIDKQLTEEKT
jgi:hypothetical protein